MANDDRRRAPRFKQRMLLKYKCISEGMHKDESDRVGMLGDISRGGMVLTTKRSYPDGAVLAIKPPESPIFKSKIFHVKVQWLKSMGGSQFQLGCSFVKLKK